MIGHGPTRLAFLLGMLLALELSASTMDPENCLSCHATRGLAVQEPDGRLRDFHVDPTAWEQSVHGRLRCRQCHADVESLPHAGAQVVDCTRRCHMIDPSSGEDFSHRSAGEEVAASVHGRRQGRPQPACKDCHVDLPVAAGVGDELAGISGQCMDCHEDYLDIRQDLRHIGLHLSENQRGRLALGYETCVRCHQEADSTGGPSLVEGFLGSFHGRGYQLGDRRSPVCVDCHGHHGILAMEDPASLLHPARAASVCATAGCHGGEGRVLPSGSLHRRHGALRDGLLEALAGLQGLLLLLSLLGIVAWQGLELLARRRWLVGRPMRGPLYRRNEVGERVVHAGLAACFFVLACSGVLLWLPEGSLSAFGDPTTLLSARKVLHHGAALLFGVALCARLMQGLGSSTSRARFRDALPRRGDGRLLRTQLAWLLGRTREPAPFGWQRPQDRLFQVAWLGASLLLVLSGLVLAFRGEGRLFLVDLARLVHTVQALLALVLVAVWHLWDQLAMPGRGGAADTWLTGRVDHRQMELEHAGTLQWLDSGQCPPGWNLEYLVDRREAAWDLILRLRSAPWLKAGFLLLLLLAASLVGVSCWSVASHLAGEPQGKSERAKPGTWGALMAASDKVAWRLGRFHSATGPAQPPALSQRSQCLLCHPPLPHRKDPATRAWINLHQIALACEACHAANSQAWVWVDARGKTGPQGPGGDRLLTAQVDGKPLVQLLTAEEAVRVPMQEPARQAGRERYHAEVRPLAVAPLDCRSCHVPEGILPFESLGYPRQRCEQLRSEGKAVSVTRYEAFHLPPVE